LHECFSWVPRAKVGNLYNSSLQIIYNRADRMLLPEGTTCSANGVLILQRGVCLAIAFCYGNFWQPQDTSQKRRL
jgi:MoaA/NifB/PqqE/SkfB family radical SAM enzyme